MTVSPGSVTTVASGTSDFGLRLVDATGSSVHLAEVAQTGFTAGAVTCAASELDDQTGTAGAVDVTVHPGETWTCTFTNTTNIATIQVVKQVDGTQVAGWTIDASAPTTPMTVSPGSVTTVASGTSDFGLSLVDAAGSSVHLAEVQQTGYPAEALSFPTRRSSDLTGTAGAVDVTVHPGETWTCTFTNTTNIATIQVVKQVDGTQVAERGREASRPTAPMTVSPGSVTTVASGTTDFGWSLVGGGGWSVDVAEWAD